MSEVRIAFIGAGGNNTGHMRQLNRIEDVSFVAICDVDQARAQQAADEFGGKVYTDHHRMLEREEMDALYISIPPCAHSDAEILAAQKRVHLFVEKPVCLDIVLGLRILEAIEHNGVISCVGYQLRYLDTTQRLRAYLAGQQVALISSHRWGGLPGTPWWRVMDQSGGQLVEQTTHQVDLMRYLVGGIVEAYAKYATLVMGGLDNFTIPDAQAVIFEFETGTLCTLSTSPMWSQGGGQGDLVFLLANQSLGWGTQNIEATPPVPELDFEPQPTPSIDEVFVQAVRTGDQSSILSSYRDALMTLDATLAANESAVTGKPVRTRMAGP